MTSTRGYSIKAGGSDASRVLLSRSAAVLVDGRRHRSLTHFSR
jgi:hypothetical protein